MRAKLWIYYDNSPQRVPMYVADSAEEIARLSGKNVGTVRSMASRLHKGKYATSRYAWVYADEEGEEQ